MSLIVTGSISIDTIDTPTGSVKEVVGGSSIYFTAAASFFGPIRLVGAVGDDFPDSFVEVFNGFGVDVEGLERRAGSKTFRWHGRYHEDVNQRDTVSVELNVLTEALPPIPKSYADSAYIFLAVTHPENQLKRLDTFPKRKLVVADTIDLYINTTRDELMEVFKRIDGLIINDSEALMLTGEPNAVVAADKLLEMGPNFVIVKKGQHGAILRHPDGTCVLPAYPAKTVIDPTGAGLYRTEATRLREAMDEHLRVQGRYVGEVNPRHGHPGRTDYDLDISLLGLSVPFDVVGPEDAAMQHTVAAVADSMQYDIGGLGRYASDRFHGGNPWALASLWLALHHARRGEREAALERLDWALRHRTPAGFFPEQNHRHHGHPASATPLGWAHAWLVLLMHELYIDSD